MTARTTLPFDADRYRGFRDDPTLLPQLWPRLHAGDAEPWPADPAVQAAWAAFHAGEFDGAAQAGLHAGGAGLTVANKAQCLQATYQPPREARRLALLLEVAQRAEFQQAEQPANANAHFWQAVALGRYAQGINVARALAQGLGARVRQTLDTTLRLAPAHADAHVAMAAFQTEVIDKLGPRLARAQGADADSALMLFRRALQLNPDGVVTRLEFAHALVMLKGEEGLVEADRLIAEAAAARPLDAADELAVMLAQAELAA